jgi:hypothetical protein
MTLTSVNYKHVSETGHEIFDQGADEWHLTTLSLRNGLERIRASEKQLEVALSQMFEFNKSKRKVFLRVYNLRDMELLVSILGKKSFSKLLHSAEVTQNALVLDIGFPLFFYPASLAPGETLVIDADGWWRMPYCIKYPLAELREGRDARGQDISVYNIAEITGRTDVARLHRSNVSRWRAYCGEQQLVEERALFQSLF